MLRLTQLIKPYGVRNYTPQQTKKYVDLSSYTLTDIMVLVTDGAITDRNIFSPIKTLEEVQVEHKFPTSSFVNQKLIIQRLSLVETKYKILYIYMQG
uniref:Uncharacterized protein n=1 Tax=viral metagenome TaxID=1070528 RepID=A0A6C0C7X0_9ZZZZ